MKILKTQARQTLALIFCFTHGLLLISASGVEPQIASEQELKDATFWKSVYEENHVVEIDISLTKESWEAMQPEQSERGRGGPRGEAGRPEGGPPPGGGPRGASGPPPRGGRGGGGTNFEYVKANIKIDGESYEDAGLRFKGNSSYRFSADGFKRPMKIDTNRFVTGQELHGRTKVNLSNAYLDPAFMKEKLAYEIYQAAGIPTPGTGWAKVTLSIEGVLEKKVIGIYVLVEQVDPNYLVRKFGEKTKDSLLMKPEASGDWQNPGDDLDQYKEAFNIKDGEDNQDQIRQFGDTLDFIKEAPDAEFAKKMGEKMDLDLYAGYLAATSLLASLDSYVSAPHNYYLMVDKADNKTRLLPWDVNEAFGTFTMGSTPELLTEWDITRPWVSSIPLLERLFATKEFPKLYKEKLSTLMKDSFTAQLAGKSEGVKIEGRRGRPSGGRPGGRPPRNRPAQPEETGSPKK